MLGEKTGARSDALADQGPRAKAGKPARTPIKRLRVGQVVVNGVGLVGVVLFLAPFVLTVLTALRPALDVAKTPLGFPSHLTLANIESVFSQLHYARAVFNTLLIAGGSTILVVVVGALAAYPLARITARWTGWIYRLFLAGMAIPLFVMLAPLYLELRDLHLVNTRVGVMLIYAGINLPLAVFFYTSFIRSVPIELEEAAAVDGAGRLRTFVWIVFPLLKPVTTTLVMFVVISIWNDLIVPLVFLQDPRQWTIMVSAYSFISPYGFAPTTLFSAAILGSLPLLGLLALFQRHITAGIVAGSVKG